MLQCAATPRVPPPLLTRTHFCWLLQGKLRLDAYLAQQLPEVSRAKIAASIKEGLILVNGSAVSKPSLQLKGGERISVELLPPEPCTVSLLASMGCCHSCRSSSTTTTTNSSSSSRRCQWQWSSCLPALQQPPGQP
jgi:ribosomal 50S subunit-recycling heat shock protein